MADSHNVFVFDNLCLLIRVYYRAHPSIFECLLSAGCLLGLPHPAPALSSFLLFVSSSLDFPLHHRQFMRYESLFSSIILIARINIFFVNDNNHFKLSDRIISF